jgi:bifunctional enzyme CysN/CysC
MVTGASTSDVAIVLVDARHGCWSKLVGTFIASLLGIKHFALAVNKMDLVEWDEGEFDSVAKDLAGYVEALPTPVPVIAFPISALHGDNVVTLSPNSPWYDGPALLDWLETFDDAARAEVPHRPDVQRSHPSPGLDFRASPVAWQAAASVSAIRSRCCRAVVAAPSRHPAFRSRPRPPRRPGHHRSLADNVDVARGDVLVVGVALSTEVVSGHVCWMIDQPREGSRYWFKHGTASVAHVDSVEYRHDLHTSSRSLPTRSSSTIWRWCACR